MLDPKGEEPNPQHHNFRIEMATGRVAHRQSPQGYHLDPTVSAGLKTLGIYVSRHERAANRALKDLKALQTERAVRTNCPVADDDAEPSPLIETSRVRRTLLSGIRANSVVKAALAMPVFDEAHPQAA